MKRPFVYLSQKSSMRKLVTTSLVVVVVLLGTGGESFGLPRCPSDRDASSWSNCFGTYVSDNGDKYVGEWRSGKQHGQGTYTFADGDKYVGGWKDHKFHGHGTRTFGPSSQWAGDKYVGEYKNGKVHGQGTYAFADGDKYVGGWRDNKFHGYGKRTLVGGDIYVGEYKDGIFHGQGTLTYPNGNKYVGEWRNGKRNGQGTHTSTSGDKYVGEWKDGNITGQGTETYPNGYKYVGKFRDGFRHGQGTETHANGNKYVGDYWNGKRNGLGTYTFANGYGYVGEWKDNKKHGQGTRTYTNGGKYVGEFRKNKKHGLGTETYAGGGKYVGEFRDGKRNGLGTATYANGRIKEGVWKNDEFQYVQKVSPTVTARQSPPPQLRKKPKQIVRKPKSSPTRKSGSTGSGFFVSKLGHIITNAHVVRGCSSITVGDNAKKQVATILLETDKRNDLALLKISNTQMASVETKSLISKLGLKLVPTASEGLLRSDDVELGEDVLVSGYPYGEIYSDTIKVTKGIVSANKGIGDDTGQFQMDAAVQPGNSGGPIYDENGNIVGVVVAQLNKLKFVKAIGSLPENVNFGIKASTVRQFLTSSGLPTKWSQRTHSMSTKELAKIAKNQTVMVVCHP
jgi:hypothetical protein